MDWTKAASISQIAATFFAAVSAGFVGLQIRAARQSSDFSSLIEFHGDFSENEKRLLLADEGEFASLFVDYLNLLEAYAAIVRSSLIRGATKAQVVERLRDALAAIEMDEARVADFKKAKSTPMAFSEIVWFLQENRGAIERSKRQLRQ